MQQDITAKVNAGSPQDLKEAVALATDEVVADAKRTPVNSKEISPERDSGGKKTATKRANPLSPDDFVKVTDKAATGNFNPNKRDVEKLVVASVDSLKKDAPMSTKMWRAMKNGLKGLVPCLLSVMLGLYNPIGVFAFAAIAGFFSKCMLTCMTTSLGWDMAFMFFQYVSDCAWDILWKVISGSVCFPAHAQVRLQDGRAVPMHQLQIGDTVQSGFNSYSEVYLFSHQVKSARALFVELTTVHDDKLQLSPRHFVVASEACDGVTKEVYARSVRPGMCLLADRPEGMKLVRVLQTTYVHSQGIYNPFTMAGRLVVDGILASSHSEWFLDSLAQRVGVVHALPAIYQLLLAPARFMYRAVGSTVARRELNEYQDTLNQATSQNQVIKPYLDLAGRALTVITASLWSPTQAM